MKKELLIAAAALSVFKSAGAEEKKQKIHGLTESLLSIMNLAVRSDIKMMILSTVESRSGYGILPDVIGHGIPRMDAKVLTTMIM